MMKLCLYCELHGAERGGYCSDVCRRSMELLRAAEKVVAEVAGREFVRRQDAAGPAGRRSNSRQPRRGSGAVRRLARAVEALG